MKKMTSVLMIVLGMTVFFNSTNAMAMGKRHKAYPDVKTISKEELAEKIKSGSGVQVVNVLDADYYKLGMIQGSLRIPLVQLEKRVNELDKTKEVVTYCASYQCGASSKAAHLLAGKGFNVRAYEGGIKEWKEAGLPTEAVA